MILDFDSFIINESSLRKLKKNLHGVLNMSARKLMRKELRNNIITFKFKKRDGTIRTAHGTLHPDYLPELKGGSPRPERQMVYYDLDKEAWRSFRSYSFIKILNIKPVDPDEIPVKKHSEPEKEEKEEIKKSKTIEKEEKEEKKPIHKEEEKKVEKPEPKKKKKVDDDEEEHEYKSPIYDESEDEKKERKEDDEKIEKLKHKEEKEEPEKEEKDTEKKSEEE